MVGTVKQLPKARTAIRCEDCQCVFGIEDSGVILRQLSMEDFHIQCPACHTERWATVNDRGDVMSQRIKR